MGWDAMGHVIEGGVTDNRLSGWLPITMQITHRHSTRRIPGHIPHVHGRPADDTRRHSGRHRLGAHPRINIRLLSAVERSSTL